MFTSATLLSLLVLAISSTYAAPNLAQPKRTLAFSTQVNVTGALNIVQADQARAKALIANAQARGDSGKVSKRASSFTVTNTAVTYVASVGVGSPPTQYNLIIDTGSSNTWVGAGKPYVRTSTSHPTGKLVHVSYGSGSFTGFEYTDTVTLDPSLVITNQSIGDALLSSGFSGVDGILGIGPVDLTVGTLIGSNAPIPTVSDNLFQQGTISTEVVGVYYAPTTTQSSANGELTFGGVDTTKATGGINYVPVTSTSPASEYWGIDQSVSYGTTSILSSTAGIVDTGTTLVLLATNAFNAYKTATGGVPDSSTGLLKITPAQYAALQPLHFNIGSNTYTLIPNAQIWPRALNTVIGGTANSIYLIVADIGHNSGQGLDFIDGYTFLERFYSVYDTSNNRVGFSTTAHTSDTTN